LSSLDDTVILISMTQESPSPTPTISKGSHDSEPSQAQSRVLNWNLKKRDFRQLGLLNALGEILKTLESQDRASRRMAYFFLVNLCGFMIVTSWLVFTSFKLPSLLKESTSAMSLEEGFSPASAQPKPSPTPLRYKETQVQLGIFHIELKPITDPHAATQGSNLVTLDLTLLCDHSETAETIKQALPKVRSLVINAFTGVDRKDFLTPDGKKSLKNNLIMKLNAWLPHGQIQDVFFSKLILN